MGTCMSTNKKKGHQPGDISKKPIKNDSKID